MAESIYEFLGWVGILLVLGAYALLSFGILASDSLFYHGLNLFGAIGIIVDAVTDKNYQPAVLNVVWAGIAIFGLVNVII